MNDELFDFEQILSELVEFRDTHYYGKYRGLVTNVQDPNQMGRIKVNVPDIYGEQQESPWALPSVPFAGDQYGLAMLPRNNDGVWIEFEGGDISRPIWTGFWWKPQQIPEQASTDKRVLVTPSAHKFILDDQANEIKIIHSTGSEIVLTSNDIKIKIGDTDITLSSGEISMSSSTISLSANSIKMDGKLNVNNGALEVI